MKYTAIFCVVFSVVFSAHGQNIEKNLPRELKKSSASKLDVPEVSDKLSEDNDRVLIDKLIGLYLLNGKQPEKTLNQLDSPVQIASGLLISEDAALSDELSTCLGLEITYADIVAIKQQIYSTYRERGFPVVDVSIPEQEITEGRLTLTITESVSGKIDTEGGRYLTEVHFYILT